MTAVACPAFIDPRGSLNEFVWVAENLDSWIYINAFPL